MGSGECSQQRHRRIQKKKTSSSIAQPNKPKAKRGFNFQPKVPTTNAIANNPSVVTRARNAIATASVVVASHNRTSSAITDETVVKHPRRSRSPRASTRSTVSIRDPSNRIKNKPILYEAGPAVLYKCKPTTNIKSSNYYTSTFTKKQLQNIINVLTVSHDHYKDQYYTSLFDNHLTRNSNAALHQQNDTLQQQNDILQQHNDSIQLSIDTMREQNNMLRHRDVLPAEDRTTPSVITPDELKKFIKIAITRQGLDPKQLHDMMHHLGMDTEGRLTNQASKLQMVKGMQAMINYHLGHLNQQQQADTLGELLFNGHLFGKACANHVATTVTKSVTTCIFSSVALLKCTDSFGGALNHSGVAQYQSIEAQSGLTNPKQGHGMLHKRWKLTEATKIANMFVKYLLNIQHIPESEFGETVYVDHERAFRVIVEAFGLTERASTVGIEWAICADGAELENNISHTCLGIKMTDEGAVDPKTGELSFVEHVVHEGSSTMQYKNTQSTDTCMVQSICLHNETKDVVRKVFAPAFEFAKDLAKNGLPARGDQPAIAAGGTLVCCGDMSLQWKVAGCGGACKVAKHFCHCCEVTSADVLDYVTGDSICEICKHNNRDKCSHKAVNDEKEIQRKGYELIDLICKDHCLHHRELSIDPSEYEPSVDRKKVLCLILPAGSVPCFGGWRDVTEEETNGTLETDGVPVEETDGTPAATDKQTERIKIWDDVSLRETIDEDGTCKRPLLDYVRSIKHTEEEVAKQTKVHHQPTALLKNILVDNIEFELGKNARQDSQFKANVLQDLNLRGFTVANNNLPEEVHARVTLLNERLVLGKYVTRIRDTLTIDEEGQEYRLFNTGQIIPCILHGSSRQTEKTLTMLLIEAIKNCSSKEERKKMIDEIETVVNRDVLGKSSRHDNDKSGWKVPLDEEDKRKLGQVTLSNPRARKFRIGMKLVVEVCTSRSGGTIQQDWLEVCDLFETVWYHLDSRKEFKKSDVYEFQKHAGSHSVLHST